LSEQLGLDAARLTEVSSNQYELPARRDWLFIWRDADVPLKQGEARAAVKVAGDEVVGYRRYVHVPEEWLRTERGRRSAMGVARMLGAAFFSVILIALALGAFRDWIRGRFDRRAFGLVLAGVVALQLALRFNEFVAAESGFSTAQPWSSQLFRFVVSGALTALAGAALLGVFIGRIQAEAGKLGDERRELLAGYGTGAALAALYAAASWLGKAEHPSWPSFSAASTSIPWLEAGQGMAAYVGGAGFLLLLFPWIARHCGTPLKKVAIFAGLGLASGALMAQSTFVELLGAGVASGLALYAVSWLVARTSIAILIPMAATVVILRAVRVAVVHAYPGAMALALLLVVAVAGGSYFWFMRLKRPVENPSAG
jgi:hypothetical protein